MAEGGEMEEGGTGAAGGQGGVLGVQSVAGTDTNDLPTGIIGGDGGTPEGSVFVFSAEQVQDAIVKAEADLAIQTAALESNLVNLMPIQKTLINGQVKLFATTVASNLAACVQVICCVHACKLGVCVCRDACIVASVHCSI
jgi:hypothetical protein